jgi:hypothetical protein
MDIHITRKGEKHGPYPEATARQFLEEGKLLPTDLAWHDGAEGWKSLSEVLGAAAQPPAIPPPVPAAGIPKRTMAGTVPAEEKPEDSEPDDPDKISVTRKGKPMGPYSREKAKEYFASGQLWSTDWGWHDGMDDWKPLNEVLGVEASAQPAMTSAAPVKAWSRRGRSVAEGVGIVALVVALFVIGVATEGTLKKIIMWGFLITGGGLAFLSGLAFLWAAFKKSVVWGLLVFCVPFVSLVFLVMHWDVARTPFLANLAGWAMWYAGMIIEAS